MARVLRDGFPPLSYTYDTLDRVTSVSPGDGLTTRFGYDFLGRLDSIVSPAGRVGYVYAATRDGERMIIRSLPNGLRTRWVYTPGGALSSLSHARADDTVVERYTYTYRPDGLLAEVAEWAESGRKTVAYEYDTVQRLVAVKDSKGGTTTFRYDKFGNRTEVVAPGAPAVATSYDWAGRMVRHDGKPCAHGPAKSLTEFVDRGARAQFRYGGGDALEGADRGGEVVSYVYDGGNALIARTVAGKKTTFVLDARADGWRPVLAVDDRGEKTLFVWEGDTPLAAVRRGRAEFFLTDHLGTVRSVADGGGAITARYEYDAFGAPRPGFPEGDLRPGFAGLFYDPKARLYLALDRAYDPSLGRFLQRSPRRGVPMGAQLGLSAYTYCGDDPVNLVDRSGSRPLPVVEAGVVGGLVRAGTARVDGALGRVVRLFRGQEAALALAPGPPPAPAKPAPLDTLGVSAGGFPVLRDYLSTEYTAFIDPSASPEQQVAALTRLGSEASLPGLDPSLQALMPSAPPAPGSEGEATALWKWETQREQMERSLIGSKILDLFAKIKEKADRVREQTNQPEPSP